MSDAPKNWNDAAERARAAFHAEWDVARKGSQSAADALNAVASQLLEAVGAWEANGWPEDSAPLDGRAALRAIAYPVDDLRARALERFEAGDVEAALADMTAAARACLHPRTLEHYSQALLGSGRYETSRWVLRTALAIDPGNERAKYQLAVAEGRPEAQTGEDVSAEWADEQRRPKADPEFIVERP